MISDGVNLSAGRVILSLAINDPQHGFNDQMTAFIMINERHVECFKKPAKENLKRNNYSMFSVPLITLGRYKKGRFHRATIPLSQKK